MPPDFFLHNLWSLTLKFYLSIGLHRIMTSSYYIMTCVYYYRNSISRHGEFKTTPSEISCRWYQLRDNESVELSMVISCQCSSRTKGGKSYGCAYSTDKTVCKKESDQFFKKLANQLKGNKIAIRVL